MRVIQCVMVKPDKVDDDAAVTLAHDIVKKIEKDLDYPLKFVRQLSAKFVLSTMPNDSVRQSAARL